MEDLDFNSLFGDEEVEVKCPHCNHRFTSTLKKVNSDKFKCPNCSLDLSETTNCAEISDSINESIEQFENFIEEISD